MIKAVLKYNSISRLVRLPGCYQVTLTVVLLIIANLVLSSCGALTTRNALPEQYVQEAQIEDMPFARFWGDEMPSDWQERLIETKKHFSAIDQDVKEKTVNYLAISGGGANGAFGAGLLAGWTAVGNRPNFWVITGVSTGALIAPFAFLGPEQDAELRASQRLPPLGASSGFRISIWKITGHQKRLPPGDQIEDFGIKSGC